MELRVLRYFLMIAKEKNMTNAAEKLYVSQPALSKKIKELELEIGAPLFIRKKRGLELTDKGVLLKERASQIIELSDKTMKELEEDVVVGDIYIGSAPTENLREVLRAMSIFKKNYPRVKFHISTGDKETLLNDIDKGLLDFGIVVREYDKTRYEGIPLHNENTLGLMMRRDHPLAYKEHLDSQDLISEPLFVARQALQDGEIPDFIRSIAGTYDLPSNALIICEEGLGSILLLDNEAWYKHNEKVIFKQILGMPSYKWYIIWKKGIHTNLHERFVEKIKE